MKRIAEGSYRQDDLNSIRLSEHLSQGRGDEGGEGEGEGNEKKGSAYSAEDARAKSLYHQSKQPSPMVASSVTLAATRPYPSQAPSTSPSPPLSFSSSSPSQRISHPLTPYSTQSQSQTLTQSQSQQHSDTDLSTHSLPNWHRNNATSQTLPLPLSLPPYLSQSVQSLQSLENMALQDNDYDRSNAGRSSHGSQLRAVQGQGLGQGQGLRQGQVQGSGSKVHVGQVLLFNTQ